MPRCAVSIITPVLNRAAMLPDALASVTEQGDVELEHIVVDGGSSDGSQAVAAAAGAKVIEAIGSSIYEAINIGVARAQGRILCLLNSDDRFAPGALRAAITTLTPSSKLEIVRGRAAIEMDRSTGGAISEDGSEQSPDLSLRAVLLQPANINACFFTPALLERVGPFKPIYPLSADREWLARAMLAGATWGALDRVVYIYRSHAGSLTIGRKSAARRQWLHEHLHFARDLLDQAHGGRQRCDLNAFFAKEVAHLAVASLSAGKPVAASKAIMHGFRKEPAWPLYAIQPVMAVLARRFARSIRR